MEVCIDTESGVSAFYQVEKQIMLEWLERCDGKVSVVAEDLNISYPRVIRIIKRHNLQAIRDRARERGKLHVAENKLAKMAQFIYTERQRLKRAGPPKRGVDSSGQCSDG